MDKNPAPEILAVKLKTIYTAVSRNRKIKITKQKNPKATTLLPVDLVSRRASLLEWQDF